MDTDIENGLGDTVGGREWGNGEICIHALSGINWITGEKLLYTGSPVWSSVWTWRGGGGDGRKTWERGDVCILMADSRCCMAETNTTLSKLKNKRKSKK